MMRPVIVLAAIFLLAGCETFSVHQYVLSPENTVAIKNTMSEGKITSIAVGEFTAAYPGQFEMRCGMNKQIRMPNRIPFEKYIREALINELKKADAYSLDQIEAGKVISGYVDKINSNSAMGGWDIEITSTFKSGEFFTVSETYPQNGDSCEQTAAALVPAVQELIHKIVTHPTFQSKVGIPVH
jgi:hypothetical protein